MKILEFFGFVAKSCTPTERPVLYCEACQKIIKPNERFKVRPAILCNNKNCEQEYWRIMKSDPAVAKETRTKRRRKR